MSFDEHTTIDGCITYIAYTGNIVDIFWNEFQ